MMLQLCNEFDRLDEHIKTVEPGKSEYTQVLGQMNDIIHMQNKLMERPEYESRWDKFFKNSALVGGVCSLLATGWVLNHERLDVITSRAFGWIRFK